MTQKGRQARLTSSAPGSPRCRREALVYPCRTSCLRAGGRPGGPPDPIGRHGCQAPCWPRELGVCCISEDKPLAARTFIHFSRRFYPKRLPETEKDREQWTTDKRQGTLLKCCLMAVIQLTFTSRFSSRVRGLQHCFSSTSINHYILKFPQSTARNDGWKLTGAYELLNVSILFTHGSITTHFQLQLSPTQHASKR